MSEELAINHEEASLFAQMKYEESNLARCYVAYEAEIEALKAKVALLIRIGEHDTAGILKLIEERDQFKQQLSVALEALNKIDKDCTGYDGDHSSETAREAIQQIQGKGE